jgi:DNA-binding ferritin-like protein (Dps family)
MSAKKPKLEILESRLNKFPKSYTPTIKEIEKEAFLADTAFYELLRNFKNYINIKNGLYGK